MVRVLLLLLVALASCTFGLSARRRISLDDLMADEGVSPTCSVCGPGDICCNPTTDIKQICPNGNACCDCGTKACSCSSPGAASSRAPSNHSTDLASTRAHTTGPNGSCKNASIGCNVSAPSDPKQANVAKTTSQITQIVAPGGGATSIVIQNDEWSDGVVFCRGPGGGLGKVYLDAGMSQTVVNSELDCKAGSHAAAQFGEGVPNDVTLAIGLARGANRTVYLAADGTWTSGACWFQDVESNKQMSVAKGPQYMSQIEWTIQQSGQGNVWYDLSSVEGVSGGISMDYMDEDGNLQTAIAEPARFNGSVLRVESAPGIGFPTVFADKHHYGACNCSTYSSTNEACHADSCLAGCPGSIVNDACGQHHCRKWYAERYASTSSYCGWLYGEGAQTYCWAMDEWVCTDVTCGYGAAGQPAADCSDLPQGAEPNTFSCGHGTNIKGSTGQTWWSNGEGCSDKSVGGVPTNPSPSRRGGVILVRFINLPWLHQ